MFHNFGTFSCATKACTLYFYFEYFAYFSGCRCSLLHLASILFELFLFICTFQYVLGHCSNLVHFIYSILGYLGTYCRIVEIYSLQQIMELFITLRVLKYVLSVPEQFGDHVNFRTFLYIWRILGYFSEFQCISHIMHSKSMFNTFHAFLIHFHVACYSTFRLILEQLGGFWCSTHCLHSFQSLQVSFMYFPYVVSFV